MKVYILVVLCLIEESSYEDNLVELMYKYSTTPWTSTITEVEVFIGQVMGKDQRQSKQQREASVAMREGERRPI